MRDDEPRAVGPTGCPLYPAIATPSGVVATFGARVLRVALRRPAAATIPGFLEAPGPSSERLALAWNATCKTTYDRRTARSYAWGVGPGERDQLAQLLPVERGALCLSIWALDALGRPSGRPALVTLTV